MQRRKYLALSLGALSGCGSIGSSDSCGPGPTSIGEMNGSGDTVTIRGTVESVSDDGGFALDDGTGDAAVVLENPDTVDSYSTGDCVSVTGTAVEKPSEDGPDFDGYLDDASRADG